jgi:hypothetical protein
LQPNEPFLTSKEKIKINYSFKKFKIMEALAIFGFPAIMVVMIMWLKNKERIKRYELQADLYAKALEKGVTLPDNLFELPAKKENKNEKDKLEKLTKKPLNIGLVFMFVGIGIWFAFTAASLAIYNTSPFDESTRVFSAIIDSVGAVGFIPMAIGIAFVIIHFTQRKKSIVKDAE